MTAARLQRYALLLAGYQYDIVYWKTSDHGNADGLSRLSIYSPATKADADGDAVETFVVSQFDPLPVTAEQVRRETRRDSTLAAVNQAVQIGDFSCFTDHQSYYHRRSELIIPPSLQRNVLDELHSSHCGIMRTKELARSYVWWPKIDHTMTPKFASKSIELTIEQDCILRGMRAIVPNELREAVLAELHVAHPLLQQKHMGHIWAAYGPHMGTWFATYGAFSTYGEENPSESTTYGQHMGFFFKHMGYFFKHMGFF